MNGAPHYVNAMTWPSSAPVRPGSPPRASPRRPGSVVSSSMISRAPGGQVYRSMTTSPLPRNCGARRRLLARRSDRAGALASGAHHIAGATVWGLLCANELAVSIGGATRQIHAARIIIATGAVERPFPIPGWTLPGVMTAGGAQILLKSSALVPRADVLAGCGPLLWLLAWQYLNAGVQARYNSRYHERPRIGVDVLLCGEVCGFILLRQTGFD